MTAPPYPRIPHLAPGRGADDDRVLQPAEAASLLSRPVVIEEKLDGANVMLWLEDRRLECALRSGPGAADRARQLGPLRAWAAERTDDLRLLLAGGAVLYGEWLLLTHTVAYDRLPSYLVALDVRAEDGAFLSVDERNARCAARGIVTPPELWRGVPATIQAVERLLGPSSYGPDAAEGVIVRSLNDADPRLAKLLRPNLDRLSDAEWARGRPRNALADRADRADREASWR